MLFPIKSYLIYFLTGGIVTVIIVALEESGFRLLSGFATLMPIFTLVAYFFIGESKGGLAVGQHAWFVLIGTIVSWVPYMILSRGIIIGSNKPNLHLWITPIDIPLHKSAGGIIK